ncbi:Egg protein [Schistosoma japonicum]|nr:Egg protein [Schistosoma japonicum]
MRLSNVINISTVLLLLKLLTIKSENTNLTYDDLTFNNFTEVKFTKLTIVLKDVILVNNAEIDLVYWNPIYNESTSPAYRKLSDDLCQLMFHCTNSSVPLGSYGWECGEAVFLPINVQIYGINVLCTIAKSSISYSYSNVASLSLRTLIDDVVSTISQGTSELSLGIAHFALNGEF